MLYGRPVLPPGWLLKTLARKAEFGIALLKDAESSFLRFNVNCTPRAKGNFQLSQIHKLDVNFLHIPIYKLTCKGSGLSCIIWKLPTKPASLHA